MLNVYAGILGRDPVLRNVEVKGVSREVADTTIYMHNSKEDKGIPVKITAWGDQAQELMKYQKAESVHFIGQPNLDQYKHANMDKAIDKMGLTIKQIDHDKTLLKEVNDLLRAYMKPKDKEFERDTHKPVDKAIDQAVRAQNMSKAVAKEQPQPELTLG